jgi:hypothetical protein
VLNATPVAFVILSDKEAHIKLIQYIHPPILTPFHCLQNVILKIKPSFNVGRSGNKLINVGDLDLFWN